VKEMVDNGRLSSIYQEDVVNTKLYYPLSTSVDMKVDRPG